MRHISTIAFLGIGLAACAGGPPPATSSHTTTVASVAPVAAQSATPGAALPGSDIRVTAEKAGYQQQTLNGKVVYCHDETPLGTRFPKTTCLDAAALLARLGAAERDRDDLRQPQRSYGSPN